MTVFVPPFTSSPSLAQTRFAATVSWRCALQTHSVSSNAGSPCSFLDSLDSVAVNADERIALLQGYDTRGLQCELLEFAPATIGARPLRLECP